MLRAPGGVLVPLTLGEPALSPNPPENGGQEYGGNGDDVTPPIGLEAD